MPWSENGDLITETGQRFRRVGWQIFGGQHDHEIVDDEGLPVALADGPHGSYAPLYIEIGDD